MKKGKRTTLTLTTLTLTGLFVLSGCSAAPETKTDTAAIQGIPTDGSKKKYPLAYVDNQSTIQATRDSNETPTSASNLIIAYQDGKAEKTIQLSLNANDGGLPEGYSYQETILTNPDITPYVEFSVTTRDDKKQTAIQVYRQPYVRYAQAPVSGTVTGKETK